MRLIKKEGANASKIIYRIAMGYPVSDEERAWALKTDPNEFLRKNPWSLSRSEFLNCLTVAKSGSLLDVCFLIPEDYIMELVKLRPTIMLFLFSSLFSTREIDKLIDKYPRKALEFLIRFMTKDQKKRAKKRIQEITCFNSVLRIGFVGTSEGMTPQQICQVQKLFEEALVGVQHDPWKIELHHGGSLGAEVEIHHLALAAGMRVVIHPSTSMTDLGHFSDFHKKLPMKKSAERDLDIVMSCDYLIACPKEFYNVKKSNTWMTIRRAKWNFINHHIIYPSGTIETEKDKLQGMLTDPMNF